MYSIILRNYQYARRACELRIKSTLLPFVWKQTFDGWRGKTSRNSTKQNTSNAIAGAFCTYLPTASLELIGIESRKLGTSEYRRF